MDRDEREVAKAKVQDGKMVLDQWKDCYFEVRAKIETAARDPRWEFDRKRLFEKTDYIASICQDLYNVLQVSKDKRVTPKCSSHAIQCVKLNRTNSIGKERENM